MRTLVVLLLLANLGWLALAQGWLQPYVGLSSQHEREPQRLAAQIAADSVRVVSAAAAASPARAAVCASPQAGDAAAGTVDCPAPR
jgi:hypothetical protein